MNLEVEARDVIRLMLQYCQENNLVKSLQCLQEESGVGLNSVNNVENFVANIQAGRWDQVLNAVSSFSLPKEKIATLYEQVILELLEAGERDLAKDFLRNTEPMGYLRVNHPARYSKLESLSQMPYFNISDAYEMGTSKEGRRTEIAELLACEVSAVPPSRLLTLINHALKYQENEGLLVTQGSNSYDLFRGGRRLLQKDGDDMFPSKLFGVIKFTVGSHPECAVFSFDGSSLVTGSADGFIEVWDFDTCKIRLDLEYQAKDELMMHDSSVICSCFSKDSEYLATGSLSGQAKVWQLSTGACVKRIISAHTEGITSITFSKDSSQLLTTSYDQTVRIHGLKSGKTLKEFRGHTSFVNGACYTRDGLNIVSVSSDGTGKLWDCRTTECLITFRPSLSLGLSNLKEVALNAILSVPHMPDHFIVCSHSSHAFLISAQGQVLKTFSSGKEINGDFTCAAISSQGKWLYCGAQDGTVYIFNMAEGQLESVLSVADHDIIAIFQHPFRNLIGSVAADGILKLWKP